MPYRDYAEIEADQLATLKRKRLNQLAAKAQFHGMSWPMRIFWTCYLAAFAGLIWWALWGR